MHRYLAIALLLWSVAAAAQVENCCVCASCSGQRTVCVDQFAGNIIACRNYCLSSGCLYVGALLGGNYVNHGDHRRCELGCNTFPPQAPYAPATRTPMSRPTFTPVPFGRLHRP